MPRKPKAEQKQTITVVIDGTLYPVILHPPQEDGARKTWYAFWTGLTFSRTTGHKDFAAAAAAAERMLKDWKAGDSGERPKTSDLVLTDEEFIEVQKAFFAPRGKKSPKAAKAAEKSLVECLGAIDAFQRISGLKYISAATPRDCAAFQRKALTLPKNWRSQHPNSKPDPEPLSPSTIDKWSDTLQAAFYRVTASAGKKCVRGVVDDRKLLQVNPWPLFPWLVEQRERPIRQFNPGELVSLLDHLEGKHPLVPVAAVYAKVLLWSNLRKQEVASLTWEDYRGVNGEHHFSLEAKWGVRRWFRVPEDVYRELAGMRVEGDDHVFAAYCPQLRRHHAEGPRPWDAKRVKEEYDPVCLGDWFYERVVEWAGGQPGGDACVHTFRKTGLQFTRAGEDVNRRVAEDARVSARVMLGHYVREGDEQLHARSKRTFARLAAALPPEVAARFGLTPAPTDPLKERLKEALEKENWDLVSRLSSLLRDKEKAAAG